MTKRGTTRRAFLQTAAGVTTPALMGMSARKSRQSRSPNILFVFSDEHRWQSMAHTEMPQVRTPHMARLAGEGFEFNQCVSNYPVCSPYRAILQTGLWPHQNGIIDNGIHLDPKRAAFGSTFRDAGYATGYVGKWHLGPPDAQPFGWQHSRCWTKDGNHKSAMFHVPGKKPFESEGYTVDTKTDQILSFVEKHKSKPFCAAVSYNAPHARFTDAPDELNAFYPPDSIPWRPNAGPNTDPSRQGGAFNFDDESYRGYHAHITGVDRALGKIIDTLDEFGIAENTILIYTSDHGSMFGSHGVGSKRQPFEESIRVPFIARWPGQIAENTSSDALFGTINLLPTLCGLAGIPIPEQCKGQNFAPWCFEGKGPDPKYQPIMHISKDNASMGDEHPAPIFRGVRTKRHTYAVYTDRPSALYDNHEDPYQLINRYNDPALKVTRDRCRFATRTWLDQAQDPFKLNDHEQAPT